MVVENDVGILGDVIGGGGGRLYGCGRRGNLQIVVDGVNGGRRRHCWKTTTVVGNEVNSG